MRSLRSYLPPLFRELVGPAEAALALLLLAALWLRFTVIDHSLPYPQHVDETFLSDNAVRMVITGDFNPHFFMYGGLPIYLTAAAMSYGFLDASNHAELNGTNEIGSVFYPYYQHPRVLRPARRLFALISVGGLFCLAWVARQLGGKIAMLLAPAWLALSPLYFEQSQAYLNVNVMGCALFWATLAFVLHQLARVDWPSKVFWPGLLCGMVIACKYNFLPVALAPLLAIAISGGERRLGKAATFGAVLVATFLLCSPFTLLDFKGFLDDLGRITYDYHAGTFFMVPGSQTFFGHLAVYLGDIGKEFGRISFVLVLVGLAVLVKREKAKAAIVVLPPLVLLLQTSNAPIHFVRNLLPFLPLWALLGALGLAAATELVEELYRRAPRLAAVPPERRRVLAAASLLLATCPFLPLTQPAEWLARPLRSRQDGTAWLLAHAEKNQPLLVARELGLHPGALRQAGFELTEIPIRSLSTTAFLAELAKKPTALVLLPRMTSVHWDPALAAAGQALLPQIAQLHQEIEPLATFGSEPVSVGFEFPTGGDPQFVIGKARRSAAELAQLASEVPPPQPASVPVKKRDS